MEHLSRDLADALDAVLVLFEKARASGDVRSLQDKDATLTLFKAKEALSTVEADTSTPNRPYSLNVQWNKVPRWAAYVTVNSDMNCEAWSHKPKPQVYWYPKDISTNYRGVHGKFIEAVNLVDFTKALVGRPTPFGSRESK